MILWAAQLGYLSVKPDGSDETRAEILGFELPDLPPSEWMHEAWDEAGRCGAGVNGPEPLSWVEIDAYSRNGGDLRPVEAQTIRAMSEAYAEELRDRNPLRKSPAERATT